MPPHLFDGPASSPLTLVLAHGSGAPMDTPFMTHFAEALGGKGWRVLRFEFAYMAQRREGGSRRPPPPAAHLLEEWRSLVSDLAGRPAKELIIGGKSLGGRMASLLADELAVAGLVCLGYPFHPPGKPEKLRTEHLASLQTPTLIVQGSRDSFGTREEVPAYSLSSKIRIFWAEDGDHSLKPRKSSGRSEAQNWDESVEAIHHFMEEIAG